MVTFYKDKSHSETGLKSSDSQRTVTVHITTNVNQDWMNWANTQADYAMGHKNTAKVTANDVVKTVDSTASPKPVTITKSAKNASTVEIDGVTYPIFGYSLLLSGMSGETASVTDVFETEYFKIYQPSSDVWEDGKAINHVYAGGQYYQGTDLGAFSVTSSDTGAVLTFPLDESEGGYYFIKYYLIPKDEATLNQLNQDTANGTYTVSNEAIVGTTKSSADHTYEYNPLSKEEIKKTGNETANVYAYYKLTLNSSAATLNSGNPIEVTDTYSNLSMDFTSISATPSEGVSWDASNSVITYTIPDATKVVITYRAKVLKSGDFSNTVKAVDREASVSDSATVNTSAGGHGSVPSINIMKYAAGDMTHRLEGAVFQLYYQENNELVTDKRFTTGADGMIHIEGSIDDDGWTLVEGVGYYLKEIEAPEGYKLPDFNYKFTIATEANYDDFIFFYDDVMTAKNYPGTDIPVTKVWSDGNEKHANDSITVQLQQSIAGGDYTDVSGKTLILNADNEWSGTFAGLDLLTENDEAITYQVKEVAVEGYTSAITGDMDEGFTITNTVKTGDLTVSKTVTGTGADTSKKFDITVTLGDTSISGAYGDMIFENGEATVSLASGDIATASGLPAGVTYEVSEATVSGYTPSYKDEKSSGTITAETKETIEITNQYESEPETIKITAEKKWVDTGHETERPDTVVFYLYKQVGENEPVVVDGDYRVISNTTAAKQVVMWQDLPVKDGNQNEITYSVRDYPHRIIIFIF